MKVEVIKRPHHDENGPGVHIRLSGDGWWEEMTVEEAQVLMHTLADHVISASRTEGYIDG